MNQGPPYRSVASAPVRSFANPYLACTTCGVRVHWWSVDAGNDPCGHRGSDREVSAVSIGKRVTWNEHTDAWRSVCPSWGPVGGCECSPPCPLPPDEKQTGTSAPTDDWLPPSGRQHFERFYGEPSPTARLLCQHASVCDNASDPPSAFCAEHSRVCACGTSTVGTYVNGGRHRADVCGWGEAALTRWAPSQTSASVDAVPDAPLSDDPAQSRSVARRLERSTDEAPS